MLSVLSVVSLFAQSNTIYVADARKGYYIKDGRIQYAYIREENNELTARRLFIPAQEGHPETVFTPEEVSEYGYSEGVSEHFLSSYVELPTGGEYLFLREIQRIDDRKSILFLPRGITGKDLWLLLDNNKVEEITTGDNPRPIWDYLSTLNDCTKTWSDRVGYPNRLRVGMMRRYYNAFVNCNEKMFPKNLFGVTVSAGAGKPNFYDPRVALYHFTQLDFRYSFSFSVGVFARFPFEEVLSFQPEVRYFRQTTWGVRMRSWSEADTYVNFETNTIRVPLLFRFTNTYSRKSLMPYVELGPMIDINFGKAWFSGDPLSNRPIPTFTPGVAAGIGAEYYINSRHAAYLGVRFNYITNLDRDRKYNLRTFEFVAGFSLFGY